MTTVRQLHNEAMILAQEAKVLRDVGNAVESKALARHAFLLELEAVNLIPRALASEPTRSILCLSAGSLAKQADLFIDAERVINEGLSGFPHDRSRSDLYQLLEQVLSEKRQQGRAPAERSTRINLRLTGDAVGFGAIPTREVTSRITAAESILDRRSRMAQEQPWQSSGPPPRSIQVFDTYVHAFLPGSFEIDLELAPRHNSQQALFITSEEIVESVVSGLMHVQDGNMEQLRLDFPHPAYLRHFVTQARELAPDGILVRAIAIQGASRLVEFTRPRSAIDAPRSNEVLNKTINKDVSQTATGKLVAGDISTTGKNRDTVGVEDDNGNVQFFKVTDGLEDLIRSSFGQRVEVQIERPKRGKPVVVDVRKIEELG